MKKRTEKILDIKINFGYTIETAAREVSNLLDLDKKGIVCTTNPEFILAALKDENFKSIINGSLLSLPDGYGVILADKYINSGKRNAEQVVPGVDLLIELCALSEKNNYSICLLGGWPKDFFGGMKRVNYDLAQVTKKKLLERFPDLNIVCATSQFSPHTSDDKSTVKYIQECMKENGVDHIDLIFVAYGHGSQEKWLDRNLMNIPANIGIGVGGSFDYISDIYRRPPKFIQKIHMEWLYRLFIMPYRIKRVMNAFLLFPLHILRSSRNRL